MECFLKRLPAYWNKIAIITVIVFCVSWGNANAIVEIEQPPVEVSPRNLKVESQPERVELPKDKVPESNFQSQEPALGFRWVVEPQFDITDEQYFKGKNSPEGLSRIQREGKWGYIDNTGQVVIHSSLILPLIFRKDWLEFFLTTSWVISTKQGGWSFRSSFMMQTVFTKA